MQRCVSFCCTTMGISCKYSCVASLLSLPPQGKEILGNPWCLEGKASACNAGDQGSIQDPGLISGSGRSPGEGNGNPLQYSWPGKSHGWSLILKLQQVKMRFFFFKLQIRITWRGCQCIYCQVQNFQGGLLIRTSNKFQVMLILHPDLQASKPGLALC